MPRKPSQLKCESCGHTSTNLTNYKNHMRTHTGEKPYVCQFPNCARAFATQGNMTDHSRRHLDHRPFKCPIVGCTKSYYRKYQLVRHGQHKVHSNIPTSIFIAVLQFALNKRVPAPLPCMYKLEGESLLNVPETHPIETKEEASFIDWINKVMDDLHSDPREESPECSSQRSTQPSVGVVQVK